jgi:thiamine biosynthesis lipoprotein ApbE
VAARVADALRKEPGLSVDLIDGNRGEFTVLVDGRTVAGKKGVLADSLTKAASVLPPEKAVALIDSLDGAAAYVAVKESDEAKEHVTASERFAHFLATDRPNPDPR